MNFAETLIRNTQDLLGIQAIMDREMITLSRTVIAVKWHCGFR